VAATGRRALVVATYEYADTDLRRLAAPEHDADSFAAVLEDPAVAGFDVTMLVNQPHHVVGEAIADFYGAAGREDLTLLYFTGHGIKDDEGRLYLAMTNTRREALMFTAISAAQLNDAMDASTSRRKVLILDCCYSGAFPAGRTAKSDEGVQTLERFQGKGRAVLTASDATQYAFEGDDLRGSGTSSIFTRHLVEAIRSGAADLDEDGDIALDELYSYVYEQVVAEMPQQRPKKQEDVDGRILIARNVHWTLPAYLQHAIDSPIAGQRLNALQELEHLHVVGNDVVRAAVDEQVRVLAADDSRSVSTAAAALLERLGRPGAAGSAPEEVAPDGGAADVVAPDVGAPDVVAADASPRVAPAPPAAPAPVAPPEARPPRSEAPPRDSPRAESPRTEPARADLGVATDFPATPVLALVLAAGALLVLSRLFPYDAANSYYAGDVGYPTPPWVLGVVLPLVAAIQLVLLRGTRDLRALIAVGLIGGVTLISVEQVLATTTLAADPDTGVNAGGAGWWLALLGTVVLLACLAVVARRGALRAGPGVAGTWRTLLGVVMVGGALFGWLAAFGDFYLWWPANIAGLLMAAVALPVVVLGLNRAQRVAALVAISLFGVWIAFTVVYSLLADTYWSDAGRGVAVVCSALVSVLGCLVAQARLQRPASDRPAAGAAPRR
jgi:hypothetical protein